ncbi:RE1 [Symbiodinium sp. CCMP2592]|nr:RE1 [Symbiodinium sp. CCMP2592]
MDGAKVPWNRRERKRWRQASAVAVHLFCGKDRGCWKSRAEAAHVVTVDQAEDIMADDTFAALLDLALTGKIKTVFGGPPRRTYSALRNLGTDGDGGLRPLRDRDGPGRWGREGLSEWEQWRVKQDTIMVFRMIFLWMVAAAVAKGSGDRLPDFLLEHPEDPKKVLKEAASPSLWATPEIRLLERTLGWHAWEFDQGPLGHVRRLPTRVLSSIRCPPELQGVRGPSTVSVEERDHDGAGFRSASWAAWAPQLKVVIKDVIEASLAGAALDTLLKMDAAFLEHLRRDHTPYRRDCRACLAGAFRGHQHRRIVTPEAWCLSLDLIGPTRQGLDENLKKVKYGLIGSLVVPDVLGKLLQPADPEGEPDDGAGVGFMDDEDPVLAGGSEADDEGEAPEGRDAAKNLAKWQAMAEKKNVEGASVVEVPFFVPLASKSAPEVLSATKEILLQVRRLGLVVRRIHTDRGREFVNRAFRGMCRDREIVYTSTTADDFRANGRVEALVGRAKCAVRTYLASSGLGPNMWAFAMRHYAARIRQAVATQLGARLPRLPPFGTKVFVRKRTWQMKKEEFTEKVVAAHILCPSLDVSRGFLVRTEDGSYLTTMVAVENVKEVSGEFEVDAPPAPSGEPGARRRLHGKQPVVASLEESEYVDKLAVCDDEHLLQDEELAEAFLDAGDFSMEAVEELLNGLWLADVRAPNRRGGAFDHSQFISVHTAGMFRHGGVVGATNLVRHRPALTKFLVTAMKNLLPEGTTFTTLSLNFNNAMQCHRDSNNESGTKAHLVACGAFVGGALWCHDAAVKEEVTWNKVQGRWLPGTAWPTYHQPVTVDPHQLHQPLPWEGMRYTITAYTVGCGGNCVSRDRHLLQGLGFPLPPHVRVAPEGGGGGVRGEMKSLRRPKGALRKFCGAFSSCAECDLVPGEDQTLESSLVGGGASQGDPACVCKGCEVDPSLCTCRVSEVSGDQVPQKFYIGDDGFDSGAEVEINEGSRKEDGGPEQWGAFGPPMVAKLEPLDGGDVESYYLLGSEVPLEVGWDLFEGHLDDLRLATVQEEYAEREQVVQRGEAGDVVVPEDPEEAPLHTKTIPNEVVRRELQRWAPSMFSEYESLVRENEAVEPFSEAQLQEWKDAGRDYDLVPGKTVHTIKAFSGRLKTRAVICGNFLAQSFAREQKYAAGADSVLIRLVLREAARRGWRLAVLDVKTAFLLAPLLFQEKRPTLVLVPKLFLLAGICKEPMWRVRKALYGMSTSPKSWETYRNQVMAKLRGRVAGGEVTLTPSGVDDSLWYVQVGARRAGAVICYVDDLLIAAEPGVAEEVARMFTTTWKCTEPQWDDVTFNGFEIQKTDDGLKITQDSYVQDLLGRYKDLEGFEEVPAPLQLKPEDFVLKENETSADFSRAAQVMAGEIQWLAGRCRPELMYATNVLSQAISRAPKEAVYRGMHLVKYLKRYPSGGLLYSRKHETDPEARTASSGPALEGFCDASFAPGSERSQQCVLIMAAGGLVAWSSARQPFVTMSTAESELVAICELTNCLKATEHLAAELMVGSCQQNALVKKVIYSDSQAALAVCRCAAGSWRTRHLRIRGHMIRELLEQDDWQCYHIDGKVMTADVGTKALAVDRFSQLTARMRMVRSRETRVVSSGVDPKVAKKLVLLLCMAALVERVEAAEAGHPYSDYFFAAICVTAVIAIWECVKGALNTMLEHCRGGLRRTQEETSLSRSSDPDSGTEDRQEVHSPVISQAAASSTLRNRSRVTGERRPPTPPIPPVTMQGPEPRIVTRPAENAYTFRDPSGKRDRWEWDELRGVVIRWHPNPRVQMFVPGQTSGGPTQAQLTGERQTFTKFANGEVKVVSDNYRMLAKPAQTLADREWKGRTELRLVQGVRTHTAQHWDD